MLSSVKAGPFTVSEDNLPKDKIFFETDRIRLAAD